MKKLITFIKSNTKVIITLTIVFILTIASVLSCIFIEVKNQEEKVIKQAKVRIEEKWRYTKETYLDKNEFKVEYIFNYIDLNSPKLILLYSTGFNDYLKNDNTQIIKFNLKRENLTLNIDGISDKYSNRKNLSFEEYKSLLKNSNFDKIDFKTTSEYFIEPSPEPTLEELAKRKEEEEVLKARGSKREICYDPKIALYVVKEGTIKSIEEASRFLKEGRQPVSNISQQTVDNVTEIWEEYIATNELEQRATPLNELTQENKNTIEYCKPLVAFGGELNPSEIFKFVD